MTIYTWILAVLLPLMINITLNFRIFVYVRSSSRRNSANTKNYLSHNGQRKLRRNTRRDKRLLLHIIIMGVLFTIGWGPVYTISCLRLLIKLHPLVFPCSIIIAELCLMGIVIDLFVYNHELRHRLIKKIRHCL